MRFLFFTCRLSIDIKTINIFDSYYLHFKQNKKIFHKTVSKTINTYCLLFFLGHDHYFYRYNKLLQQQNFDLFSLHCRIFKNPSFYQLNQVELFMDRERRFQKSYGFLSCPDRAVKWCRRWYQACESRLPWRPVEQLDAFFFILWA